MNKICTYIINLEKSTVRKQYMTDLLSGYDFLNIRFIPAIDGRQLSDSERISRFDYDSSLSMYGKMLNAGEVGCALSHRKAYQELLMSDCKYALILEDDISIVRNLNELNLSIIDSLLTNDQPIAIMLSGDYWYFKNGDIVKLFSAVGAYAYLINRAAAKKILSIDPPYCVADDWMFYKRKGLKLFAVHPYAIDANMNMATLGSDVKQDTWAIDRSKMSTKEVVIGYFTGAVKRMLKIIHHFESKVRIIDNVAVGRD